MTLLQTASIPDTGSVRPRDLELDLFGLTHPGLVRKNNQDHFLLCTVHPQVLVHNTSLPAPDALPLRGERLATIMLVADGVGGSAAGSDASQLAVETITQYVSTTLRCYHAAGSAHEGEFEEALRTAAITAHAAVRAEAATVTEHAGMATTLTLCIVIWPWVYVLQVGDSRCYQFLHGKLRQVTRDQTMAQSLVDQGVLAADKAAKTPFSNVLTSAIGGEAATPEVSRLAIHDRDSVLLICSDGLTKHVTDAEIAEQLGAMTSSEQVCRTLLDLALERGGSDNITILVGRAPSR
ncbi:MAG: protein phosphatase 2C domain-containing protein [Gemmatimonadota bacterium]